jgi:hypothetical protein
MQILRSNDPLEVGNTVTIKVKNIMWPSRHLYAPGVVQNEYNVYTGTIMREKWFDANEIGITTGDPSFPFRRIDRERIVEVNNAAVDYTPPPSDKVVLQVPGSKGNIYTVIKEFGKSSCTCPGYTFRKTCKHLELVAA